MSYNVLLPLENKFKHKYNTFALGPIFNIFILLGIANTSIE